MKNILNIDSDLIEKIERLSPQHPRFLPLHSNLTFWNVNTLLRENRELKIESLSAFTTQDNLSEQEIFDLITNG